MPASFRFDGSAFRQGGLVRGTAPAGTKTLSLNGDPVTLDPDGDFLIAFDRDAGPNALLVATLADGRSVTRTLPVSPGSWRIERVDVPLRPTKSSEAFLALRRPELAQINAARAERTGAEGWRQDFQWPARGRISGIFGSQRIYRGGEKSSYHSGVDVAVPTGTPVYAPADGVVILAADHPFTLEGNLLMLDHGMGLNSAFLHLSRIEVKEGDHVRRGQEIARSGATGRATGPHLHWSMKWHDARIDPQALVPAMAGN